MRVSHIVAFDSETYGIGKDNRLVWSLPSDMRHFRETTINGWVLMGRKTYESIGRPLKNRTNIVITSDTDYVSKGCHVFNSIEEGIDFARRNSAEELFIIGGAEIYSQTFNIVDTIYATVVLGDESTQYDSFYKCIDGNLTKFTIEFLDDMFRGEYAENSHAMSFYKLDRKAESKI